MNTIPRSPLHRSALALAAALALNSLAPSTFAADWTGFRGPSGNSVSTETNLPTRLDPTSISWQTALPGRGLSSPLIVGDRVFVTCSSGPKQDRLHIIAFNAADGSKRWERQFWATGRTMCHEKTSVAAPTPVTDGQRLYALFSSNDCVCVDLDGNLVWYRGLGRDYPNASNSLGMSSSPVFADGVLVVQVENDSESFAAGLDALDGHNLWKLDRPKMANWTSPTVVKDAQGRPLVSLQSGKGLAAVRPKTGETVWSYTDGASTIPSSTLRGNVLFVPSNGLTALQIDGPGASPKQLWRAPQLRPGTPSPVVLGDRLFTLNDGGVLSCGDATSGQRLWQLRLKGPFSATPVAAGPFLYCVNEKGLAQVVDTQAPEGAVVSELTLEGPVLSTPSIAQEALYIRSDGKLWKISRSRTI